MSARRTTSPLKLADQQELESAIMDAKGDMMLLDLACEQIQKCGDQSRQFKRYGDSGRLEVLISEDELTTLCHAMMRMRLSMRAVETTFYAEVPA